MTAQGEDVTAQGEDVAAQGEDVTAQGEDVTDLGVTLPWLAHAHARPHPARLVIPSRPPPCAS